MRCLSTNITSSRDDDPARFHREDGASEAARRHADARQQTQLLPQQAEGKAAATHGCDTFVPGVTETATPG